jgi:hypothetical protein
VRDTARGAPQQQVSQQLALTLVDVQQQALVQQHMSHYRSVHSEGGCLATLAPGMTCVQLNPRRPSLVLKPRNISPVGTFPPSCTL